MIRSKKIGVYFLSVVYLILLISVIFPHHHHEEIVCYTNTHCETDDHSIENIVDALDDHHHDHNTSEESEQCISLEYYIVSASGKSFKASLTYVAKHVFADNLQSAYADNEFAHDLPYSHNFPFLKSHYTVFLKQHIPLRAPPEVMV